MVKDIPIVFFYKTYEEAEKDFDIAAITHGPYRTCQIDRKHRPLEAWIGEKHFFLMTKSDYMWWCVGRTYRLDDGDVYRSGYRLKEGTY